MCPDAVPAHILLIDEAPTMLALMQRVLAEADYRVSTALAPVTRGQLRDLAPDLIVQELLFGGTANAGWTFLLLMQTDPDRERVPMILCTTESERISDTGTAEMLNQLGVRVLIKPFDREDLLTAVSEELGAQRLINQVRDQDEA